MVDNPLFRRARRRRGTDVGREAERKIVRERGGRLTPASGAMTGAKGDIDADEFLVEAKTTRAESLSIKREWLHKISGEAAARLKFPAVNIRFAAVDGRARGPDDDWVMIPAGVYRRLTEGEDE